MSATDLTPIMEAAIGLGMAVAIGIVYAERTEILHRMDNDAVFLQRVSKLVMQQAIVDAMSGPSEAKFRRLIDRIIELHDVGKADA